MPPLRERTEDIPLLVEHFLKRLGRERKQTYSVSTQALSALISYEWPGNVRELENALEATVALNRSGVVNLEDLPPKVRPGSQNGDRLERLHADLPSLDELAKRYLLHVLKVTRDNKARAASIMGIDRKTLYRMVERFKLRF
ncbi:MAG: helix-turn-helix domain-containing protein [Terriglobia bacterium]